MLANVGILRQCTRSACRETAVATLTYVYADSTAVLGPLATFAEPHCYDLCAKHSARLTAPRGWEVIHLARSDKPPAPGPDDLLALADAVREAANPGPEKATGVSATRRDYRGALEPPSHLPSYSGPASRRGHLRILED